MGLLEVNDTHCEDRVLDGPASGGGKGSKGRNELDCIWGLKHTHTRVGVLPGVALPFKRLQGYLAHEKLLPPRTLQ